MWILAGLILLLPGIAWLVWFRDEAQDAVEYFAEAIGISIALTAVLALIFFVLHISISGPALIILFCPAALLVPFGFVRKHLWKRGNGAEWLAAGLYFGGLIAWRLYQARSLVLPAWVDPLQHVLIVRKFLEVGGIPGTLDPYLPVPFYYHYGFHAEAAVFTFFSHLSPDQAALIFGQILNAAVCLSVYRLGKALWREPIRAGAASVLVGFFTTMPAYYLTWGRYTLLTGLILLPLAMADLYELSRGLVTRSRFIRLSLLTAGVGLSHYLAACLLVAFAIALGLVKIGENLHQRRFDLRGWQVLVAAPLSGVILGLPWFIRVWQYSAAQVHITSTIDLEGVGQAISGSYAQYLWYLAGPQRNYWLLPLAAIGLLLSLRSTRGVAFTVWAIVVGLEALPIGIQISPFRPDHLVIIAFLPITLLASHTLISAAETLGTVIHRPGFGLASGVFTLLLLGIWGIRDTVNILNPVTILANQDDLDAIHWIQNNTPSDSRFFINTTYWQQNMYRGTDGGAWILPLTGRWILQPPPVYIWGAIGYVNDIQRWSAAASQLKECTDNFWGLISEAKINYIYIHQNQGSFQPESVESCKNLTLLYHKSQIWIYKSPDR